MLVCRRILRVAEDYRSMASPSRPDQIGMFRYIRGHWQGDLPLRISFWINGSITAVIAAVLTIYGSDELYRSDLSQASWLLASLTLHCVSIIIAVWSIVGVWRSATRYRQKGGAIKWVLTAKVLGLIGVLCFAALLSRTSSPALESALILVGIDPLGSPAALKVTGRQVHIDGTITDKVAERFEALIDKHPEVDQISMTSFGGRPDAAVRIASIISERKLNTVVVKECSSACTIIFLSGKARALDVNSVLGFHGPRVLGLSDLEARYSSYELNQAYEAAGLPEAFINQALETPPTKMWYPSDDILFELGVINSFTKAQIRQKHAQSIQSFNESKPLKIDEFMSVVSAKAYDTNITYTYVISAEKNEIDWASMSKQAAYDADELICGDAVSNLMVKSGATYSYLYLDKNGRKIGAATVGKCRPKN